MKRAVQAIGALTLLATLAGSPALADPPSELARNIVGLEKRLWKAWAEGDAATLDKLTTDDYRSIGSWGRQTKQQLLEGLAGCKAESYALSDFDLVVINDDAVLLTYVAEQEASCDGHPLPSKVMSSGLYVLRNDHWRSALYTETALAP